MDANSVNPKALALEPVDDSTAGGEVDGKGSANAGGKRDLGITTTDEFLAAAAREYEEGHIDVALWRLAGGESHGDAPLAIAAYLRARATALKLQQRRARRYQGRPHEADASVSETDQKIEPEPSRARVAEIAGATFQSVLRHKYSAAGAAALVCVVMIVWLIASPRQSASVPPALSAAVSASSRSAPALPPATGRPAVGGTNQVVQAPAFEDRVQELKQAGNWNVLVLYASEWTRKQPNNASAWHELGVGYTNLRQFVDALEAAKKAAQLAPENATLWSDVGYLNLTVQRLPEAGTAFDRALALTPDHADALCGAASVAKQQGRSNDADALAKRVNSDAGCPGMSDTASVSVATGSAMRRPVPSAGR